MKNNYRPPPPFILLRSFCVYYEKNPYVTFIVIVMLFVHHRGNKFQYSTILSLGYVHYPIYCICL